MAPLSPDTGRAGSRDCRPVNQSPGPGLEAKVIPECHTYNKQTNKQTNKQSDSTTVHNNVYPA